MYRCFKLSIQNEDFFGESTGAVERWKKQGKLMKTELQKRIQDVLEEVTNPDGIIDGEKLCNTWFPVENKDVFLSYSHNDEELALIIAGLLKDVFGLSVFIDALVWGSADDLLEGIDKEYCLQTNGTYNYRKRNFSTSHVHAMLTTSIMKAMDRSEAIFFLNTLNSNYKLKDGFSKDHTSSPWIYEEIMMTSVLRERNWKEHRVARLNELLHFQKDLNVSYPLKTDDFKTIAFYDLIKWKHAWETRRKFLNSKYGLVDSWKDSERTENSLNVLYKIMFGNK